MESIERWSDDWVMCAGTIVYIRFMCVCVWWGRLEEPGTRSAVTHANRAFLQRTPRRKRGRGESNWEMIKEAIFHPWPTKFQSQMQVCVHMIERRDCGLQCMWILIYAHFVTHILAALTHTHIPCMYKRARVLLLPSSMASLARIARPRRYLP